DAEQEQDPIHVGTYTACLVRLALAVPDPLEGGTMKQITATDPSGPRWRPRLSAVAVLVFAAAETMAANGKPVEQPEIGARVVKVLRVDGLLFKDLDKNGTLDAYEDWRRPIDERVEDIVGRMQVEEKAGLMVGPSLQMGPGGTPSEQPTFGVNP